MCGMYASNDLDVIVYRQIGRINLCVVHSPSRQLNSVRQRGQLCIAGRTAQNSSSAAHDKHIFITLLPFKFTVGFVEQVFLLICGQDAVLQGALPLVLDALHLVIGT